VVEQIQSDFFAYDKRVLQNFLGRNAILLVSLKALREEECTLNAQGIPCGDLVLPFIYFCHQIFHFVTVKRSLTHQELVTNDAKSPNVDFVGVIFFLQQLRRAVQGGSTNTELRACSLKDCAQAKVTDSALEGNLGQIYCRKKAPFLVAVHFLNFGIVWEVKQNISQLHIAMNDVKRPHVIQALHNLAHYHADLKLGQGFPEPEQHRQVESVAVVLNHVDV